MAHNKELDAELEELRKKAEKEAKALKKTEKLLQEQQKMQCYYYNSHFHSFWAGLGFKTVWGQN